MTVIGFRHGFLFILALASACGSDESDDLTRVTVTGIAEEELLQREDDGTVHLENDADVYAALVRIGTVTLRTDAGLLDSGPVNVDLFEPAVVLEESVDAGNIDTVALTFPEPEGNGVTKGESLSVFVAGLIDDRPFEYRDRSMESLDLSVATPIGDARVVNVWFDLEDWFESVEERELVATGDMILIDEENNAAAAALIESAIRASVSASTGDLPDS
jgi:hypothetical protein